ncbi:hypothetical protein AVEN_93336-1 [Araneus ventricosus]|uniref:Uncharacterized protein n=1 Tax=Araneus ventricosus TaxID=182803 RepID=A0A4Y2NHX2_ARAVE|nr:hypothetical protein AVEN_93336-1 [Araneus ventricosus]
MQIQGKTLYMGLVPLVGLYSFETLYLHWLTNTEYFENDDAVSSLVSLHSVSCTKTGLVVPRVFWVLIKQGCSKYGGLAGEPPFLDISQTCVEKRNLCIQIPWLLQTATHWFSGSSTDPAKLSYFTPEMRESLLTPLHVPLRIIDQALSLPTPPNNKTCSPISVVKQH